MPLGPKRISAGYIAVLGTAFIVAMFFGWTSLAERIDGNAYDWVLQLRSERPWTPQSVIIAIDEATLRDKRFSGVGQLFSITGIIYGRGHLIMA